MPLMLPPSKEPKSMKRARKYSLREILQFAYELQTKMGPVNIKDLPQAMLLANEVDIVKNGGEVKLPDWRRKQLEKALKVRFPESIYYAVERGILPKFESGARMVERS